MSTHNIRKALMSTHKVHFFYGELEKVISPLYIRIVLCTISSKKTDTPQPFYNTIVGVHTVLVKQRCYIQTKMYRLY